MSNTKKISHKPIVIVLGPENHNRCFEPFAEVMNVWPERKNYRHVEEQYLQFADVVVFTGGSDVDPNIYGERRHSSTHSNINRDIVEQKIYDYCKKNQIKMAGICRGSQFLTVMNGGKIVQHINHHAIGDTHDITVKDRSQTAVVRLEHVQVTSTHHQMMYPWSMKFEDYEILAYAKSLSAYYDGAPECELTEHYLDNEVSSADIVEPEVVWYPNSASLCCQFHPEIMDEKSGGFKYYQRLLAGYMFN